MFAWTKKVTTAGMVLSAVACGSSSGSSTCYDSVIASAQNCLPPATATGVLNDAGTTCIYSSGDQVSFTLPESDGISNFVVTSASGSVCMSYQNADGGVRTLQTPAGTAVSSSGSTTCPNGVPYTGSTPVGNVSAYGSGSATFDLVTADGGLTIFNCSSS
jgi:hypothetical protein